MKDQVRVSDAPKKITGIKFGVFSPQDMYELSELEIFRRELYDPATRQPMKNGVLDPHLGVSTKLGTCTTCGKKLADCTGHYGHIQLNLPVFHIGFFKAIIQILQNVCKNCSSILLEESDRTLFLRRMRSPNLDSLQRKSFVKKINERCRKSLFCEHCCFMNGPVKKAGALKITHDRQKLGTAARKSGKKGDEDAPEDPAEKYRKLYDTAVETSVDMKNHLSKAMDDLNPLRVMEIFKRISDEDCELMGLDPVDGRPERFVWTYLPVPPVCIRPSVVMETAAGTNEDDITVKLLEIIHMNNIIRNELDKGAQVQQIVEHWDFLQLQCAMYINSELPGVPLSQQMQGKPIRGFCQRLKGKQGRFRGNLSGKRVDFSSRTVISPDPNLKINEVAIPELVAKVLTYPERVFAHNIERLRQNVLNGADVHPGANYIQYPDNKKVYLKFVANRAHLAKKLAVGDIVERHLQDEDVVLFNRQPSLHKLSIMAHYVKVRPYRTFRLNECVCTPYNADFDGDEMNCHVPQTEEARAEALTLMGVKENLVTPRNGEPMIAATQDFLTACYLLTRKDVFFDRAQFAQGDALTHVDIPPPAIIKPKKLWTGKQIFSVVMRPSKESKVRVNLDGKCRTYTSGLDMCVQDGYLVIRDSDIMCGTLDKGNIGSGSKATIFYAIMRDYGTQEAIDCMSRVAKLSARYLGQHGFSIGIEDVRPGDKLVREKNELVARGYGKCDSFMDEFKNNKLQLAAGCTAEQTLEAKMMGELSRIRDDAGQICFTELDKLNSPLIMAKCGSKGSKINISQMIASVGQQVVSGTRIPEGFVQRTLPHFPVKSKTPAAKGFVQNSFFSGLTPTEFFFHTMGGREGLVDTAVKTAETGYMQRRLMKALEDLSTQYDLSVRNSSGLVVQFKYGDDGLDPANMEENDKPVDLSRAFLHALWIKRDYTSPSLTPFEIKEQTNAFLATNAFKQKGVVNVNDPMGLKSPATVSDMFRDHLEKFMNTKAQELADIRERHGLSRADGTDMEDDDYNASQMAVVDNLFRLTRDQLKEFFDIVKEKYFRAVIEPGTAVGAVGAQSIGEPGTQMTLKTFHFAGVASMNVTLGVPRIKEIINASKIISTPIITTKLVSEFHEISARVVKGRIEKTTLGDIAECIYEVFDDSDCYIVVKIDMEAIKALQLEITLDSILTSIMQTPKLKLKDKFKLRKFGKNSIKVFPPKQETKVKNKETGEKVETELTRIDMSTVLQNLKQALPKVIVKGIPTVNRAVINNVGKDTTKFNLLVEGYGLRQVMATEGVNGLQTTSNHVMEVFTTLGIEAARSTIMNEIQYTMGSHGMSIDTRHVMLLADLMSCKGEILGITRFGIAKMKDSVLMLASFEKTTDHLFDAAIFGKADKIEGVSECIIMGIPMPIGTGLFKLVQTGLNEKRTLAPRQLLFDSPVYHTTS